MLTLVFAEAGLAPTLELGPFEYVCIDGETLRSPDGEVLARHRAHAWMVQDREFFRLDCDAPVRLRFEGDGADDHSSRHGPFVHFSCADGIAYGDGSICANLDLETKRWYSHLDACYWRTLVVKSAAAPAA
jgi:hypothetical protein